MLALPWTGQPGKVQARFFIFLPQSVVSGDADQLRKVPAHELFQVYMTHNPHLREEVTDPATTDTAKVARSNSSSGK